MDEMDDMDIINKFMRERDAPLPDDEQFSKTPLTAKFRKGLWKKYGMTEHDLHDWQYCGGDWNKNQPWHYEFKNNFKLNCKWPPEEDECVCGAEIYYNCFMNRARDFVIVTGRCCIDKFLGPYRRRC